MALEGKKVIVRRGCRYPERIMNSTKSSVSLMFACTASGKMLPPYVVYKAKHLYDSWTEGGPSNTRYNRTDSGWFDSTTFEDCFFKVILPYARSQEGKKAIIGDNLASHVSLAVVSACEAHNISFVLLPPNSTHLTQPLDVSVFGPMKTHWRSLLSEFKATALGRKCAALPKAEFPRQLAKLMEKLQKNQSKNIQSGFRKYGIYPLNVEEVLSRLPEVDRISATSTSAGTANEHEVLADHATPLQSPPQAEPNTSEVSGTSTGANSEVVPVRSALDESLINMLSNYRYGPSTSTPARGRKKMLAVPPGKSVTRKRLGRHSISSDSSDSGDIDDVILNDSSPEPEPILPKRNRNKKLNTGIQQRKEATLTLGSATKRDGKAREMDERELAALITDGGDTEIMSVHEADTDVILEDEANIPLEDIEGKEAQGWSGNKIKNSDNNNNEFSAIRETTGSEEDQHPKVHE